MAFGYVQKFELKIRLLFKCFISLVVADAFVASDLHLFSNSKFQFGNLFRGAQTIETKFILPFQ